MSDDVPLDVIVDILVGLSVKPLCRFKCVSELWCSLISAPRFARRHLNLAMIDNEVENERRKLILVAEEYIEHVRRKRLRFTEPVSSLYQVECEAMASNDVMVAKLDFPLINSSLHKVKFIGSLNGLLCLRLEQGRIYLLNPATKELKKILNFHSDINHSDHNIRPMIYGFGYDNSIDDYNVVKIMNESIVYIYSLKTDTWRRLAQSFSYKRFNGDSGVSLNRAVHWLFSRREDPYLALIVAFDFTEGKFRELPRPSSAENGVHGIRVLGGCLYWLSHDIDYETWQHHFWVMKDYGVKESWTKVLVIDFPSLNLRPLSYLKNDDALCEINGRLVVYNPREHRNREVAIHGIWRMMLEVDIYVESLISPTNV